MTPAMTASLRMCPSRSIPAGKLGLTGRKRKGENHISESASGEIRIRAETIQASVDFDYFPYEVEENDCDTLAVVERIVPQYEYWMLQRELSLLDVQEEVSSQTL